MNRKPHLRIQDYVRAGQHRRGAAELARRGHEHLLEHCATCSREWWSLGRLRETLLDRLDALETAPERMEPPLHYVSGDEELLQHDEEMAEELRYLRRRAIQDRAELLRTPPDQRIRKVKRARRRFRSLLLAELLIEDCRQRVRNDPADALSIVETVPYVLAWTRDHRIPYAGVLLARAAAHRANALRVLGDLPAAEQAFIALRRDLAEKPLGDPRAVAELASLEASLCIGQRRFPEAEELLEEAALAARHGGDREALARIRIQQANLNQECGKPEQTLPLLEEAAALLHPEDDAHLFVATVTGRVNALCDLERPAEALRLLRASLDAFEATSGPFSGAFYRFLEGRCALEQGELETAEPAFAASRDAFLSLDRSYDAALIELYRAEALFRGGEIRELRKLALRLVPDFRSRGVEGDTLVALQWLARAVAAESVTASLFSRLREQIDRALSTVHGDAS